MYYEEDYELIETFTDESEALSHHGRKGMKHGVRNGPPYPLEREQLSASLKKHDTRTFSPNEDHNSAGASKKEIKASVKAAKKAAKRAEKIAKKQEKKAEKAVAKEQKKETDRVVKLTKKTKSKKKLDQMTDEELSAAIERLRLEKNATELNKQIKDLKAGPVKKFLGESVNSAAKSIVNAGTRALGDKLYNKFMDDGKSADQKLREEAEKNIKRDYYEDLYSRSYFGLSKAQRKGRGIGEMNAEKDRTAKLYKTIEDARDREAAKSSTKKASTAPKAASSTPKASSAQYSAEFTRQIAGSAIRDFMKDAGGDLKGSFSKIGAGVKNVMDGMSDVKISTVQQYEQTDSGIWLPKK